MKPIARKKFSTGLLLGLLAGVAIGGAVMYLIHSQYMQKEPMSAPVQKITSAEQVKEEKASMEKKIKETKEPIVRSGFNPEKEFAGLVSDAQIDSAILARTNTILDDTLDAASDTATEEIIVGREQMIKSIAVEAKVIAQRPMAVIDSLAEEVSGMSEKPETKDFIVEFWQSPLKYKGYKMANNKIVLYGLDEDAEVALYRINERVYLRHFKSYYELHHTFAFMPFKRLTDEAITGNLR